MKLLIMLIVTGFLIWLAVNIALSVASPLMIIVLFTYLKLK